jgi:peptidoglycan/xylan/chitin deacetylase (PgdA/CDA1 family)
MALFRHNGLRKIMNSNDNTTQRQHSKWYLPGIALLIGAAWLDTGQAAEPAFNYPGKNRNAVSISFDDGRASQVQLAMPLLERLGVKATFYLLPYHIRQQLPLWQQAVKNGHEIGNHTSSHTCTGNFRWLRNRDAGLEQVDLAFMQRELQASQADLQRMLGVSPRHFAYPCGQTFVGRGRAVQSYVPLIAEQFVTGRTWNNETGNDPTYTDFAQLTGLKMDGLTFHQMRQLLEQYREQDKWLILVGHEVGVAGPYSTDLQALEQLIHYLQDPANGYWLAPVGEVASYIQQHD